MKLSSLIIFATVFAVQMAKADTLAVSMVEHALEECLKTEEGQTTGGMQMCHGLATETAEKMLNFYYEISLQQLDLDASSSDEYIKRYAIETKSRLVASQEVWIQYRDVNCSLAGVEMLGGSGEGIVIAQCYSKMTIDRLKQLMELL